MSTTLGTRQKEVISLLEDHGESTAGQLAEHTEMSEKKVRKTINRLERRGLAESRPNPANPKGKLRRLTDE